MRLYDNKTQAVAAQLASLRKEYHHAQTDNLE